LRKKIVILLLCIAGFILISSQIPSFLTFRNLINVTRQSAMIAMCSVGLSIVIISGGIDLSTPGLVALCPMVSGMLMLAGVNVFIAILIGMVVGILIGFVSGILVANIEIPPFIATYVVGQIAGGIALVLGKGASIGGLPDIYMAIGNESVLGIPISTLIMIFYVVAGSIIMTKTRMGKHIYAHGGSEITVKFEGVDIKRLKYFAYTLSAFCTASAGILLSSQMNAAHPTQGADYLLDAVAAATIGGVSLLGGEGKIWMSMVGALFMGCLRNALTLLGMHPFFQNIFVGTAIIIVVAISVYNKNKAIEAAKVF